MLSSEVEHQLEAATVALNEHLYADGVGLPVPPDAYAPLASRLTELYAGLLAAPDVDGLQRLFALENWVEAQQVTVDSALADEMDRCLLVPGLACSEGPLSWRNWKAYEREAADAAALGIGFERLVAQSAALIPLLQARLERAREAYAAYATTPVHVFATRERVIVDALRDLLWRVGEACREPFRAALNSLSQAVFGRAAGPAELRALYLNRMFEPNAALFDSAVAVPQALANFARIGFDLSEIHIDVENRPRKYAGAFCFPVRTPQDVRVSVRIASAHHLVDMLYHEFGHAVHFSGIRPDLPFLDRYWIHSGTHETFSTLFEHLLDEPLFLQANLGLQPAGIQALRDFARFKALLTGAWLTTSAVTVLDTWLESLPWPEVEARYARHAAKFMGVPMPGGFARLETFTSAASIYPAGYVLAEARVAHWRRHLRALGGTAWWQSPAAQSSIRAAIAAGGSVTFPMGWSEPDAFLAELQSGPAV